MKTISINEETIKTIKSQQISNSAAKDDFLYLTAKEIQQSILPSNDRKALVASLEKKGVKFRFQ